MNGPFCLRVTEANRQGRYMRGWFSGMGKGIESSSSSACLKVKVVWLGSGA